MEILSEEIPEPATIVFPELWDIEKMDEEYAKENSKKSQNFVNDPFKTQKVAHIKSAFSCGIQTDMQGCMQHGLS